MKNSQILTTFYQKFTIMIMLFLCTIGLHAKETIVLGLTGTVFKDDMKNFLEWEKYLESKMDVDIQIRFSKTYAQMNELLKENKVDVAYVCNSSYTKLDQQKIGKLLVIPIVEGTDQYYSYTIAKKESRFEELLDFKGALFAFTDPESNSGAIAPSYHLISHGLKPKTFFKSLIFTYEHGESIKAVLDGFVDGASVDSIVYTRFGEKYPHRMKDLKIVEILGPFTNSPIVVRSNLSEKTFQELQKAFATMHLDTYGKTILDTLALNRFDIPSNQDFSNVAHMFKIVESTP